LADVRRISDLRVVDCTNASSPGEAVAFVGKSSRLVRNLLDLDDNVDRIRLQQALASPIDILEGGNL
jgi:hypothetical protein